MCNICPFEAGVHVVHRQIHSFATDEDHASSPTHVNSGARCGDVCQHTLGIAESQCADAVIERYVRRKGHAGGETLVP